MFSEYQSQFVFENNTLIKVQLLPLLNIFKQVFHPISTIFYNPADFQWYHYFKYYFVITLHTYRLFSFKALRLLTIECIHVAAIWNKKEDLEGWAVSTEVERAKAHASNFTQACSASGSYVQPPKPHFDLKMVVGWIVDNSSERNQCITNWMSFYQCVKLVLSSFNFLCDVYSKGWGDGKMHIEILCVPEKAGPQKYRQVWHYITKCFKQSSLI